MTEQPEEESIGEKYRNRLLDQIVAEDEGTPQSPVEPPTFPVRRSDYFQSAGSVTALVGINAPLMFDMMKLLNRESLAGVIIVDQITTGVGGITVSVNKGNNFNLNLGDQYFWPPLQAPNIILFPVRTVEIWAQAAAGSNYRIMAV